VGLDGAVYRIAAVPEPGTWLLFVLGVTALSLRQRRRH
jgi:hypothetical protein